MMPVKIKICGITRGTDALAAAEAGADAVGFIFFRESPRYIDPGAARAIIGKLPPFVTPVGVFVNASRDAVMETLARSGVRCLQFHGEEPPEDTAGFPVPVIKAFRVGEDFDPASIARYDVPACLLDSAVAGKYGGTGTSFDWSKARDAARFGRIILGGGIHPGNAAQAVRSARPYGIDVSSGVESSPGVKDAARITALIHAIRTA